jgi:hypothetical protein
LRRPAADSVKSRSICGVNHTAAILALMSAWDRGAAPSSRKTRRSESSPVPVPISNFSSPRCHVAATAQAPEDSSPRRARSENLAPRRPRPGTRSEMASRKLVFPVPFGPVKTLIGVCGLNRSAL